VSDRATDLVSERDGDEARIGIVGMGYVGLPLAMNFIESGLEVVGVEADRGRATELVAGRSPIDDVSDEQLQVALGDGLSIVRPPATELAGVSALFVCVPTPINEAKDPDLGAVLSAARLVREQLRRGQLVILQSTTYPGTTNGAFREELERSGLRAGTDFDLAFAPERINPGDPASHRGTVPRLVGGTTPVATQRAARLLRRINSNVHELSSPDAAEMAKLLENVFRNVNIALVNQLALLCERMGLDVWEVVDAAATKPFGFMPFRPGPGVGGHCIPVDPYYLSWRARQFGFVDRFVEVAGDINFGMPRHVVDLVVQALNDRGKALNGSRVGLIGVAFKPNVRDARNSPAAEIANLLFRRGAAIAYHDPHVPSFRDTNGRSVERNELARLVATSDVLVVTTLHAGIDWSLVYERGELIVDTVNSSRGHDVRERQVLRLGAGWAPVSRRPAEPEEVAAGAERSADEVRSTV
jgi:UDP-N-acetyl-D-glucosamine dehydrogenase